MFKVTNINFSSDKKNWNKFHKNSINNSLCIENLKDNDFQSPKYSINSSDDEYFLENTNEANLLRTFEATFAAKVTPMEVDSELYDDVEILSGNDMENKGAFKTIKINNKLVKVPVKDSLIVNSKETEVKTSNNRSFHFYLSVLCIIVGLIIYYIQENVKYPENAEIESDLRDQVFSQDSALDDIINVLNAPENIKILAFTGSSGVGKTFVANTLKNHFPNVLNFYGKLDLEKNDIIILGKSNLLVFDDLDKNDTENVSKFINNVIKKFNKKNVQIVIVLIFTIQSVDDDLNYVINYDQIPELVSDFNNYCNYKVNIIEFKEFTQTDVENWLRNKFKSNHISHIHWQKITNNVLKGHSILYKGLKNLNSRIKLEIAKLDT